MEAEFFHCGKSDNAPFPISQDILNMDFNLVNQLLLPCR